MADFGEGLPCDGKLFAGAACDYHNRYAVEWSRLNGEVVDELKAGTCVSRAQRLQGSGIYAAGQSTASTASSSAARDTRALRGREPCTGWVTRQQRGTALTA
jgi:hypothetical protein